MTKAFVGVVLVLAVVAGFLYYRQSEKPQMQVTGTPSAEGSAGTERKTFNADKVWDPNKVQKIETDKKDPATVQAGSRLDGNWLSQEHKFGFNINGKIGIATLSNSSKYRVGEIMLRIEQIEGSSFSGSQIFTDGNWNSVDGQLIEENVLRLKGGGYVWTMNRQ